MPLYRYVKKTETNFLETENKKTSHKKKYLSIGIFMVGLFFLGNVVYPIVSYQLFLSPKFSDIFLSPTVETETQQGFSSSPVVLGQEIELVDFTQPKNWFPQSESLPFGTEEKTYRLSIPKLKISEAVVVINGEDLKNSLVQYPGTALPGRFGNTVVFGHSVLPQFFNPKNYVTIFSTLPTLKPKDEIIINFDGVKYKYMIEKMIEVTPDDLSILAQRYDDSYLTLITCVPPGTYLKRLIVRARLTKI